MHFLPPDTGDSRNTEDQPLGRFDLGISLVLAAGALVVYVLTLAPGLLESDSAELQTQAVMLGYAHPTGYPVYLLLAKLATLIPVGELAYRVNLFSAIMGALATAGLYLLGRLLSGRRWLPIAGAVAMAVSPTFWSQAIIAKVYTSGIVFMLGVLICLELWRRGGRSWWLFAAACLGGLSLGVHITHWLMAPAALLLLAITPRPWKTTWMVAVAGALTGVALVLACYWVIDRADSPTSYLHTVIEPSRSVWNLEPRDLDNYWGRVNLCLRPPQYTGLLFSKAAKVTLEKLQWYMGNLQHEFPWPWLVLSAAGVYWLARRNWKMTLVLLLTYVAHLSYDLIYDMGGIHVLYLATYVPIVLFGVAGLALACDCLSRFWSAAVGVAAERGRLARIGGRDARAPAFDVALASLALALVLWPMLSPSAWNCEGRRDAWVPPGEDLFRVEYAPTFRQPIVEFHQRVREMVDDMEPGAVLFTGWCPLYAYYYVAHVEMGRNDLVFLQDYPQPYYFELADSAVEYVRETSPHRPVYFTHVVKKVAEEFELSPVRRGQETLYRVGKPLRRQEKTQSGQHLG